MNTPEQSVANTPQRHLPSGTVVDERFEIVRLLGAGGMCLVYEARDLKIQRKVALKFLHQHLLSSPDSVTRFQREAVAVSTLHHPNIVDIFSVGVWNGQPYLAIEFLDGETLSQLLAKKQRLTLSEALPIFLQICDSLEHAHGKGIIHRDIKPSNVMIVPPNNSVKLLDFGLAKVLPESGKEMQKLTQTDGVLGSLLYMSPEQCTGLPVDHRTDIYSLGCLMYEVLTGASPFMAATAIAVMQKHIAEDPVNDAALPNEIKPIVFACLEKNPDMRPKSATNLKRRLLGETGGYRVAVDRFFNTIGKRTAKQTHWILLCAAIVSSIGIACISLIYVNQSPNGTTQEIANDETIQSELPAHVAKMRDQWTTRTNTDQRLPKNPISALRSNDPSERLTAWTFFWQGALTGTRQDFLWWTNAYMTELKASGRAESGRYGDYSTALIYRDFCLWDLKLLTTECQSIEDAKVSWGTQQEENFFLGRVYLIHAHAKINEGDLDGGHTDAHYAEPYLKAADDAAPGSTISIQREIAALYRLAGRSPVAVKDQ